MTAPLHLDPHAVWGLVEELLDSSQEWMEIGAGMGGAEFPKSSEGRESYLLGGASINHDPSG